VNRFGPRAGAALLLGVAGLYMVLQLATGRSAHAEVPPDLSARPADLALDVWKAAALLVDEPKAAVVDVRPADAYARYHLPRAASLPGASAEQVVKLLAVAPAALIYAGKDEVAQKLVADVRSAAPQARVHYLPDGARAWYLAFTLPVALFAESGPPDGYPEALAAVNGWFGGAADASRSRATEALQTLAKANYQPTLLKAGKKAAGAGGGKKKIGGGCG
jgi:rhodanese-related sulfurtransferase